MTTPNLKQTALFECIVLTPAKVSPAVRQMHPGALSVFKGADMLEFLGLPTSRTLSPALIIEYQTHLSDKKLLQAKPHKCCLRNASEGDKL